jgi:hypothetical protein
MAKLPVEEKYYFVHTLLFDLAVEIGDSAYEMIGILEIVKSELLDSFKHIDCDGDCDNCDHNKDKE